MRPSRLYLIAGILILVLIGQSYAVSGQMVTFANHVVLNEVETNPQGDDSKSPLQWVELYNPTSNPVNIGGWTIGATTGLRNVYTISSGTVIQSQQFLVYTYGPLWFPHNGAIVQLNTADGTLVDQTPPLTDQQGDSNTWQRIYDGYNTNSPSDWIFKIGTPGSSNGKPQTTTTTNQLSISVSTDKQSYIFGDVTSIKGKVSQLVTLPGMTFIPQSVNLVLSGTSGYQKTFTLYPGSDLTFSTSVKLDQVLGFGEGKYTISVSYGDAQTSSSFLLSSSSFVPPTPVAPTTIYVSTDMSTYTITQPIILQGNVSKIIPLTPIKYKVYDPNQVLLSQGTIFPDSHGEFTTFNSYQQQASTSGVLVNTVNPTYGIYRIFATYGSASASTLFTLVPTEVQTAAISISTDKKVYAPGETVIISGSTNFPGLQNLGLSPSLQIVQTFTTAGNRGVVPNTLNIKTFVNVGSDNTFTYKFNLAGITSSLGNYRVIVTLPHGVAQTDFVVTENPSTYQTVPTSPFSIITDKSYYAIGDPITISGQIANPILMQYSNAGASVNILVQNSTGMSVTSQGSFINNLMVSKTQALIYSAYPDNNGVFQVKQTIQRGIFNPGNYTLKATYSQLSSSTTFSVYDPLATGSQGPIVVSTDKKVYGVGETVQLNGKISGLTGTSSYTLVLIKPDGGQITFPLTVTNGFFSWSWVISSTAVTGTSPIINTDRSASPVVNPSANVYGIYRITISSQYGNSNLFFQVSQNPQPNQEVSPIAIETDKTNYISTDVAKISGQVVPQQNTATNEQNTMVQIMIFSDTGQQAFLTDASVNQGGQFFISIPFHPGVWKTGNYRLYAQYLTANAQTVFKVVDPYTTSSSKLQLFMITDHDKYLPGQTVFVAGRTSYIVSVGTADLAVGLANDTIVSEGQVMSKEGNTLPRSTVSFDQTGSFTYDYKIPNSTPIGNYTIAANVPFGIYNTYFQVVNQLPMINATTGANGTGSLSNSTQAGPQTMVPSSIGPNQERTTSNMLVQRALQIPDSTISISLGQKSIDNKTYYPRELDGLLRLNHGDETNVSIKVISQDGTCVIGPDQDCKVIQSAIQSGLSYQIVKFDGMNFLVGFSGYGARLQQFSIIPANSNDVISDGQWNIEIIKKDQITRFYYQLSYVSK